MVTEATEPSAALAREVAALSWYHTIELGDGVVTRGEYDTRRALARIPFPADLRGVRCLDVGTHDGFWAFEMERRGATEVVAIDLDDPRQVDFSEPVPELPAEAIANRESRRKAFDVAHRALGSTVKRCDLSVYDLPNGGIGQFGFAFIGTLLLHLREPVRALTAIRDVLDPGGMVMVNDMVSLRLTLLHPRTPAHSLLLAPSLPYWWIPNARGLRRYLEKAAFVEVVGGRPYFVPRGAGFGQPHRPRTVRGYAQGALSERGMTHAWASGRAPVSRAAVT